MNIPSYRVSADFLYIPYKREKADCNQSNHRQSALSPLISYTSKIALELSRIINAFVNKIGFQDSNGTTDKMSNVYGIIDILASIHCDSAINRNLKKIYSRNDIKLLLYLIKNKFISVREFIKYCDFICF